MIALQLAIVTSGSILLALLLWGRNVAGACWGPIDDHEIVDALGPDGIVRLAELGPLILATEIGAPGRAVRYRPSYYALRFGEMLLWGDHPARWYATRVALFAATAAVLWWLLGRLGGTLLAGTIVWYAATAPYWSDIWGRIGPSETYACLGAAIAALGTSWASAPERSSRRFWSWILVSVGLIVACGSKENLIILVVPVAWIAARRLASGALTRTHAVFLGVALLYGVGIELAVAAALWRSGADVYGRSVALPTRLASAIDSLRDRWPAVLVVAICVVAELVVRRLRPRPASTSRSRRSPALRDLAVVQLLLLLGVVSQLYYYGGSRFDRRYAFPLDLLELGIFASPLLFAVARLPQASRMPTLLAAAGSVVFAGLALGRGIGQNIESGLGHRDACCRFSAAIDRAVDAVRGRPRRPIVIWSDRIEDYEEILSIKSFLRSRGVENPVVLSTPEPYPSTYFQAELVAALADRIRSIRRGEGFGFSPPTVLAESGHCVALGIHQRPPPSPCRSVGTTRRPG